MIAISLEHTMLERFIELLCEATRRVPDAYFMLPVAYQEDPIYRERVGSA